MLRVLVALGLWLVGSGFASAQQIGPPNMIICNKSATFSGVTGSQSLVAPAARTSVLVCGWDITSTGAATFAISFGTQTTTPCDTNTVAITPAMNVSTNAVVDHQFYAANSSAVGSGLCINPSIAGVSGIVYYTTVSTPQ